jgi:anti-sigma B factor antagonist
VIGLEVERVNEVPVARSRQDIDAANARRVYEDLIQCLENGSGDLVLDLSATRYLDSAGIDMLLRLSERLRQRRAALALVIPSSSQLSRLAEIVGLPGAMPVHETVEDALAALRGA